MKKGFTLIETIIGLALVSIIFIYILPAISSVIFTSKKIQDESKLIYALQEAVEENKYKEISENIVNINGFDIEVSISSYQENDKLNLVMAKCQGKNLKVVVEIK